MSGLTRDSNIELLRIVAMFLVLTVHADFLSLGAPTQLELQNSPMESFTRIFFQSLSIVCVDVFVLISGWFGIRPKMKGFCSFVFQCVFFLGGIYIMCALAGIADFSFKNVLYSVCLFDRNWFIVSYVGMYIFSPMMNALVKQTSEKQLLFFLIAFFVFQTVFGLAGVAKFFVRGYSSISFMGLYMLARYVRLYNPKWCRYGAKWYIGAYLLIVMLISAMYFVFREFNLPDAASWYAYINPLVIISALCLLLYFSKLKFSSVMINKVAASAFAVFLLHTQSIVMPKCFISTVRYIYDSWTIEVIPVLFLFFLVIFIVAICLDQIRILAWSTIEKCVDRVLMRSTSGN